MYAITLARGGSKRLPNKNIKPMAGQPMLSYTIDAAIETIGHCYVSTDDEAIMKVAQNYKGNVLGRPSELALDTTPASAVLNYIFTEQLTDDGVVLFLNSTSPLRTAFDINIALAEFERGDYDSLVSVCKTGKFFWEIRQETAVPINYDPYHRKRSQDVSPIFQENGAIYISTTEFIRSHNGQWLGGNIGIIPMPSCRSFEVDSLEDFRLCEAIIQYGQNYGQSIYGGHHGRPESIWAEGPRHTGDIESGRFSGG